MSNLNRVVLAGNVGTDPEQREFESGAKVTKFSIGVSRWNKKEEKEHTDWIDVETFNKLGDYVKKGMKIVVGGSLVTSVYQKEDGTNIKRIYVLANQLELMQKSQTDGNGNGNTQNTQNTQSTQTQSTVAEVVAEDLGSNADYPEDENTVFEDTPTADEETFLEDEIPF